MEFNATFIVAFISFIMFTVIMNLILYKPLSDVVEARQKFVDDHYNEASIHKQKAQSLLTEKAEKIDKSKSDAKSIIISKAESAKAQKTALTTDAQQSALKLIDGAKSELQSSKNEAQNVLAGEVIGLAQQISSKILGADIAISNVDGEFVNKIMQEG